MIVDYHSLAMQGKSKTVLSVSGSFLKRQPNTVQNGVIKNVLKQIKFGKYLGQKYLEVIHQKLANWTHTNIENRHYNEYGNDDDFCISVILLIRIISPETSPEKNFT